MRVGVFGKRILGEKEYERQKKIKKAKADVYGPRVTGHGIYRGPVNKLSPKMDSNYMSLPKMAEAVTANVALVQKLLDMEMKRKSGPRSKALKILKFAEMDKAEPDEKILETIEKELAAIMERAGLNPDEPDTSVVSDEVATDAEAEELSEVPVFALADEEEDEEEGEDGDGDE